MVQDDNAAEVPIKFEWKPEYNYEVTEDMLVGGKITFEVSFPVLAFRLYPFLGNNDYYFDFLSDIMETWPPWWRRMIQRWLLGWRWVKCGDKEKENAEEYQESDTQ